MTMVASHEVTFALASTKTTMETYQCWKDSSLSNYADAGLKGLKCHVFVAIYTKDKFLKLEYRMYKMKVPGTALVPATQDLKAHKDGTFLFHTGTDTTNLGFKNTKVFENIYAATKGEAEVKNNTTPLTLA